jgi:tRNA(Ile)-lysidine synthetase-like protein
MSLLEITQCNIHAYHLIPESALLLIGVSGGADSLALAHVLHRSSDSFGFKLHIATLDHQLRGQASADDARFVEHIAASWGIPVTAGQTDVRALAQERHIGIEAAARLARYNFLTTIARQIGASRIAVAHHANDQAETVLMHIIRGAGSRGLAGMLWSAPVPGHADLILIRPFLNVTRTQIETYCHENNLQPRHDETNSDTSLLRNRIRLETIPHLERTNQQVIDSLIRMADISALESDYLQEQLEQAIAPHIEAANDRISINRAAFRELHPALRRRFIDWAAQKIGGSDIGYDHIINAVRLGLEGQVSALAILPGSLRLRVDYERLFIEREDAPLKEDIPLLPPGAEITLTIPGSTRIPGANWELRTSLNDDWLSAGRLAVPEGSRIWLRTRRTGDRFAPLGMNGHTQKIKEWMIDHKIPRALRDRIPLLMVDDQIAAMIVGEKWVISEAFAVHSYTINALYFAFYQLDY